VTLVRAFNTFALLAGLAMTPAMAFLQEEPLGWSCQRDFREPEGVLRVNKVLTSEGRHIAYTVGFRSSGYRAETDLFWIVPPSGDWFARIDHLYLNFEFPSAPQKGPVQGLLYEGGTLVANGTIMDRQWVQRLRTEPRVGGRLSFNAPYVPARLRIHGTSDLVAVATGPDRRKLARVRFPLPDWARTDRQVRSAIADLDRDALDFRNRCGQQGGSQESSG